MFTRCKIFQDREALLFMWDVNPGKLDGSKVIQLDVSRIHVSSTRKGAWCVRRSIGYVGLRGAGLTMSYVVERDLNLPRINI